MKSLKKGFTLVELMVVIVIIGILAALAIPRFLGATNKTKATEFKPILKQIYTMQDAYRQETNEYAALGETIGADLPPAGYTAAGARIAGGKSMFGYDVLQPAAAAAATVPLGAAQVLAPTIMNAVDGTPVTLAESVVCIDQIGNFGAANLKMQGLANIPLQNCVAADFTAAENI